MKKSHFSHYSTFLGVLKMRFLKISLKNFQKHVKNQKVNEKNEKTDEDCSEGRKESFQKSGEEIKEVRCQG